MRRPLKLRRPVEDEVLRREKSWHRRKSERLMGSVLWVGGDDNDERRKMKNLLHALFYGIDLPKGGNDDDG